MRNNHLRIILCDENDTILGEKDGVRTATVYVHNVDRLPRDILDCIIPGNFMCILGGKIFGNGPGRKHLGVGYGNCGTGWSFGASRSQITIPKPKPIVDFTDMCM
eukprot:GHVQ01005532.1.p1 GENE.GHVQ01005532.1~~GHVQ01005532.1.p1  ORF type:complete len:105 (-),score=0.38 GHVQ01005532.1:36-350(-)